MNWYLPKEHGAWAMLIVPYLLGVLGTSFSMWQILFFLGIFTVYCSSGPFLAYIRQPKLGAEVLPPILICGFIGAVCVLPVLIKYPFLLLIIVLATPFFTLNIYFAKKKKERLFINDLSAIIGLSTLTLMAYYIGEQSVNLTAWVLFILSVLFFTASVLHVKSLIRERKNRYFQMFNYSYHSLLLIMPLLFGFAGLSLLFVGSLLRTVFFPRKTMLKPMKIGMVEIITSILFVVLTGVVFY
ncbi:YwiC-like family protein [Salipaludibacillus neizhouensis]|nr:YwiC-like family protein [Salipaludibacillus neizhouensis]